MLFNILRVDAIEILRAFVCDTLSVVPWIGRGLLPASRLHIPVKKMAVEAKQATMMAPDFAGLKSDNHLATQDSSGPGVAQQPLVRDIHDIQLGQCHDECADLPVKLQAAWALLVAIYTNSTDVIFGINSSPAVNEPVTTKLARPCPVHLQIDWQSTVLECLKSIRSRTGEMVVEQDATTSVDPFGDVLVPGVRASETALVVLDKGDFGHERTEAERQQWGRYYLVVECLPVGSRTLRISFHSSSPDLDGTCSHRMISQFAHLVRQLCSFDTTYCSHTRSAKRLIDLNPLCDEDKERIWVWNASLPRTVDSLLHGLFSQSVMSHPQRVAIDAWDGSLSYAELDEKSTNLAAKLIADGVADAGKVVPLCFDKTIWTTITILAIAKAGSIFVLLDPHQPIERLKSIMDQLEATVVLARPSTAAIAKSLTQNVLFVDDTFLPDDPDLSAVTKRQSCLSPANTLYTVFTSGSTGVPKGVKISHANLCSAATHQARALGFANSRVLDSSSYSFDAYVFNTFYTLLSGGCLCVCSDTDRINRLQETCQEMRITLAQLTPSLSQVLDPEALPNLRTLILTGEKLNESVLTPWVTAGVRVVNAYGPTECTIMCAANTNVTSARETESIGRGLGATLWLADVNDIGRLAPIGAVGELLIEGPLIGQGYLGDEVKTEVALCLPPPAGYLAGVAHAPQARLFRTRDLARYNVDGSISFIGRADTQIKINGQRVEVGEIEHWLGQYWLLDTRPVVEAVKWPSGATQLIAFVGTEADPTTTNARLQDLIRHATSALTDHLPKYMIPSAYFPVQVIPMTASGKTDRKTLRQLALASQDKLLPAHQSSPSHEQNGTQQPLTTHELMLRKQWAAALDTDESLVGPEDNFFAKGDSLAAIRLVALSRQNALAEFTVADVFRFPRLADLACHIGKREPPSSDKKTRAEMAPFSLLCETETDIDNLRAAISQAAMCSATDVEDAYPCSPVQEEMMALSALQPRDFVTYEVLRLPAEIDMAKLLSTLQRLAQGIPILRTCITHTRVATGHDSHDLIQSVIRGSIPVSRYSALDECLDGEKARVVGLGDPLFRLATVEHDIDEDDRTSPAQRCLVLIMHHAIYDGWFLDLLMKAVRDDYAGIDQANLLPYGLFIQYLERSDRTKSADYWLNRLNSVDLRLFPAYPTPTYRPSPRSVHHSCIPAIPWVRATGVTPTTLIHAAWAMILSTHSGSDDVVFGATALGRQVPMTGIESVGGPTIATIPVRIKAEQATPVGEFLRRIQTQAAEAIPFTHFGIRNIRRLSLEAEMACQFRTFLVVQPPTTDADTDYLSLGRGSEDIMAFNTYALMLECSLNLTGGLDIRASFDEEVITSGQVREMLSQMERILTLLCSEDKASSVSDLMMRTTTDSWVGMGADKVPTHTPPIDEVELHLRSCMGRGISDVVVEIVELPELSKRIVAFLCVDSTTDLRDRVSVMCRDMANHFSRHLTPSHYLPVQQIPVSEHGGPDRHALQRLAQKADPRQFVTDSFYHATMSEDDGRDGALTEVEEVFRRLWASTIRVPVTSIGKGSSFLFLGGDSLTAMKFVAAARTEGYSITVAEVLKTPILAEMAAIARRDADRTVSPATIPPFTLLDPGIDRGQLAAACHVSPKAVEDAYPCSPLQESMMSRTLQRPGDFVSRGLIELPPSVEVERLKRAWSTVAATTPILRTRIIDMAGRGLLQVVLDEPLSWHEYDNIDAVQEMAMGLGQPLIRFCIVRVTKGDQWSPSLLLTIHHAIYDRWSVLRILKAVESVYSNGTTHEPLLPYNIFVNYLVRDLDEGEAKRFWAQYLSGLSAREFPCLPSRRYQPTTDAYLKHHVSGVQWPRSITPTTVLKAGWATVMSLYTNCDDTLFGMTVMGRQGPVAGIEAIAGPTIATVPIRVLIDWKESPLSLLRRVQSQAADMIPVEQYGLGRICRLGPDAELATQFQSLLVVQPPRSASSEDGMIGLQLGDDIEEGDATALTIECAIDDDHPAQGGGFVANVSYDTRVLDPTQAQRVASLFEHVVRQLCIYGESDDTALASIDMTTREDRDTIWTTNVDVPREWNMHLGIMLADRIAEQSDATAVRAWDGELSYGELYSRARRLAYTLVVDHGAGPEIAFPICSAKSLWVPVAMLAVLMSGGTIVLMDPSQPQERLTQIVEQVGARVILTSSSTGAVVQQLGIRALVIDYELIYSLPASSAAINDSSWVPELRPEDAAYIVFTSGSTGAPKGAAMTHANCCSALFHQNKALGITQQTRVIDLPSYAFDVCWEHFVQALYFGGCICIPSDAECLNDMTGAINRFEATFLQLTPSVARAVDPATVPSVEAVSLIGEALCMDDVTRWPREVKVLNVYGPCECTPTATVATYGEDFFDSVTMGLSYGVNSWIVSTVQPDTLAPVGGEGELVLEGPLVGRGYLNAPEQNEKALINNPAWLSRGNGGSVPGRQGRLYRTGDLVKTDSRGRLVFMGRKDAQVKLRGQRVELGEVETHSRRILGPSFSVVAEVIDTNRGTSNMKAQSLALFICTAEDVSASGAEPPQLSPALFKDLSAQLAQSLPKYMVPSSFIRVEQFPLTASGKIHRKALRAIGAATKAEEMQNRSAAGELKSENERLLASSWAETLGITPDVIGRSDSFFDLGGDSLAAIHLVGVARKFQLHLTVLAIFRHPRLEDMARQLEDSTEALGRTVPASSAPAVTAALDAVPTPAEVSKALSIEVHSITDILPVTEFQEYAIRCTLAMPRTEWNYFALAFRSRADVAQLRRVCEQLFQKLDALRSVFAQHGDGYVQVFLNHLEAPVTVTQTSGSLDAACADVCQQDLAEAVSLGSPFVRCFIVQNTETGEARLILGMSHACYDGISSVRLAQAIGGLYEDRPLPDIGKFAEYLGNALSRSEEALAHWSSVLEGSPPPLALNRDCPRAAQTPEVRVRLSKEVTLRRIPSGITAATVFAAALGAAMATQAGCDDVVIGRAVSGRALPFSTQDTESVIGPCLNLVPARIRFGRSSDATSVLTALQEQFTASIPHETTGLAEIVKHCTSWPLGTSYGCVFYYQGMQDPRTSIAGNEVHLDALQLDRPDPPEPLRLDVTPHEGGEKYMVDLSVPTAACNLVDCLGLLDGMVDWLSRLGGDVPAVTSECGGLMPAEVLARPSTVLEGPPVAEVLA